MHISPSTQVALSPLPSRATEVDRAQAYLTKRSDQVLPDNIMKAQIGRGSLAGGLNDQIRFRVEGTGPVAERKIVADSPLAAALMQTISGPKLLKQLEVSLNSTGPLHEKSNIKGFMLHRNNESVLAGVALAELENRTTDGKRLMRLAELHRVKDAGHLVQSWLPDIKPGLARAGAWNASGWISFMPDTSRAMLIAAGAYQPGKGEERLREASLWANYIMGNASHEVQHSVTFPTPKGYTSSGKWIEEGTANVLSRTPVILNKHTRKTGVTGHSYAGHLAHPATLDTGWSKWDRPKLEKGKQSENDKNNQRNYQNSQPILRDLTKLVGGAFNTNEGIERVRVLLQSKSSLYVPGVLANEIIKVHDLDPKVYESLRLRIRDAIDDKDAVKNIIRDFGINA